MINTRKGKVALVATIVLLVVTAVTLAILYIAEINKPAPVAPVAEPVATVTVTISNCSVYVDGKHVTSYRAFVHGEPVVESEETEVISPDVRCEPAGSVNVSPTELEALKAFARASDTPPVPIVTVETAGAGILGETVTTASPIVEVEGGAGILSENAPSEAQVDTPAAALPLESAQASPETQETPLAVSPSPEPVATPDVTENATQGAPTVGNAYAISARGDGTFSCHSNGDWVGTVPAPSYCEVIFTALENGSL